LRGVKNCCAGGQIYTRNIPLEEQVMLTGRLRWLPLAFCLLSVIAHAQETKLETGKAVEREIAGGESHSYQIQLQAGQFVRFRLEQRAIDSVLILTAPGGKQLAETNLTGVVIAGAFDGGRARQAAGWLFTR
jgi:hypothetical protein